MHEPINIKVGFSLHYYFSSLKKVTFL